jgi:hypothetical protein
MLRGSSASIPSLFMVDGGAEGISNALHPRDEPIKYDYLIFFEKIAIEVSLAHH